MVNPHSSVTDNFKLNNYGGKLETSVPKRKFDLGIGQ